MSRRSTHNNKQYNVRRGRMPSEDLSSSYNTQEDRFDIVWDENNASNGAEGSVLTVSNDDDLQVAQPPAGPVTRRLRSCSSSRSTDVSPSSSASTSSESKKNSAAFFALMDCAIVLDEERLQLESECVAAEKRKREDEVLSLDNTNSGAHAGMVAASVPCIPAAKHIAVSGNIASIPMGATTVDCRQVNIEAPSSQYQPSVNKQKSIQSVTLREINSSLTLCRHLPTATSPMVVAATSRPQTAIIMSAVRPAVAKSSLAPAVSIPVAAAAPTSAHIAYADRGIADTNVLNGDIIDTNSDVDDATMVLAMEAFERSQAEAAAKTKAAVLPVAPLHAKPIPAVPVVTANESDVDDAAMVLAMEAFERSQAEAAAKTKAAVLPVAPLHAKPIPAVPVVTANESDVDDAAMVLAMEDFERSQAEAAAKTRTLVGIPNQLYSVGNASASVAVPPQSGNLNGDADISFTDFDFEAMDQLVASTLAAKAATAATTTAATGSTTASGKSNQGHVCAHHSPLLEENAPVTCVRLVAVDIAHMPDLRLKEVHCILANAEEALVQGASTTRGLVKVVLKEAWYDNTALQVGDVFHVLTLSKAGFDRRKARGFTNGPGTDNAIAHSGATAGGVGGGDMWEIVLTSTENLLVVHPDILLSPSKISESTNCVRRGVINETVRSLSSTGYQGISSHHALLGTMKHDLLEKLLMMYLHDEPSSAATESNGRRVMDAGTGTGPGTGTGTTGLFNLFNSGMAGRALTSPPAIYELSLAERDKVIHGIINAIVDSNIEQLFTANVAISAARQQLSAVVPPLLSLVADIGRNKLTGSGGVESFPAVIDRVMGSEETKWCPQLGLKGQMDGTAILRLESDSGAPAITARCPVELKTGTWKPSVTSSHRAQLIFYILMLLVEGQTHETMGSRTGVVTGSDYSAGANMPAPRQRMCNVGLMIYISGAVQGSNSAAGQNLQYGNSESFGANVARSTAQYRVELVVPQWHEIIALLQIRNKLASAVNCANDVSNYSSSSNSTAPNLLPPMLRNQRECEWCYQAAECMLLHAAVENGNAVSSGAPRLFRHVLKIPDSSLQDAAVPTNPAGNSSDLVTESIYRPLHMQYLRRAMHMLTLEHNDGSFSSGSGSQRTSDLWTKSSACREKSGDACIGGLLINSITNQSSASVSVIASTTAAAGGAASMNEVVVSFYKDISNYTPAVQSDSDDHVTGMRRDIDNFQLSLSVDDKVFVSIEMPIIAGLTRSCSERGVEDIEDLGRFDSVSMAVGVMRQLTNVCTGRVLRIVTTLLESAPHANHPSTCTCRLTIDVSLSGGAGMLIDAVGLLADDRAERNYDHDKSSRSSRQLDLLGSGIYCRLDKDSAWSSTAMLRHNVLNLLLSHGFNSKDMNTVPRSTSVPGSAGPIPPAPLSTGKPQDVLFHPMTGPGLGPGGGPGGGPGTPSRYYNNEEVQAHQRRGSARMRAAIVDLKRLHLAPTSGEEFRDSVHLFAPVGNDGTATISRITYQKYVNILMKLQSCARNGDSMASPGCAYSARIVGKVRLCVFTIKVNDVRIMYRVESLVSTSTGESVGNAQLKTGADLIRSPRATIIVNRGEVGQLVVYPGCYPWELFKEYCSVLNLEQKEAVKKMLRTPDYVLLLGMPGTGKTTVLSLAVRALIARGQKVLISSYTHSAVDNLLLKIVQTGVTRDICMRLGSSSGSGNSSDSSDSSDSDGSGLAVGDGAKLLQPYIFDQNAHLWSSESVVAGASACNSNNLCPTTALGNYLNAIRLVACTVLTAASLKSSVLKLLQLDWSIVDEAGQITQPAILGSLLSSGCSKFALIGDFYQLPPLVKSQEAASLGLDISLFRRLAEAHPEAVVYLTQQYRMNAAIVHLTNALIYDNKLKCATPAVATARLVLPYWEQFRKAYGAGNVTDRERAFSFCLDPENCVVFINTDTTCSKSGASFGNSESNIVNTDEAVIVFQLVQLFKLCGLTSALDVSGGDAGATVASDVVATGRAFMEQIGVISPFRAQVSALNDYFARQSAVHTTDNNSTKINSNYPHNKFNTDLLKQQGGMRHATSLPYRQFMSLGRTENEPFKRSDTVTAASAAATGVCEVSTVDKYQGRDKEVIILSTVKRVEGTDSCVGGCYTGASAGNLLRDWRRINVAISRAKKKLIIIGSVSVMNSVPVLRTLVDVVTEMNCIVDADHLL